jgi:hypothetical protein
MKPVLYISGFRTGGINHKIKSFQDLLYIENFREKNKKYMITFHTKKK